jgi:hypothetical protein
MASMFMGEVASSNVYDSSSSYLSKLSRLMIAITVLELMDNYPSHSPTKA